MSSTYTAVGTRATMTDPDAGVTSYQYDSANRLTSLTNPINETTGLQYDALGRLVRQDNANGTYGTWTFDAAGQVTNVATKKSNDAVILSMAYTRDNVGNSTQITDQLLQPNNQTWEAGTWTFGYDNTDRLTLEKRPDPCVERQQRGRRRHRRRTRPALPARPARARREEVSVGRRSLTISRLADRAGAVRVRLGGGGIPVGRRVLPFTSGQAAPRCTKKPCCTGRTECWRLGCPCWTGSSLERMFATPYWTGRNPCWRGSCPRWTGRNPYRRASCPCRWQRACGPARPGSSPGWRT